MALYWNTLSLLGWGSALLASVAALAVLFAAPSRFANRVLAGALFFEGVAWLGGNGLVYSTDDPAVAYASQCLNFYGGWGLVTCYLLFASTLATPLSRPLATRLGRVACFAPMAAAVASFALQRDLWLGPMRHETYAVWESSPGPLFGLGPLGASVALLYVFACAISAYRRARPGSEKRRAGYVLLAFGTRDVLLAAMLLLIAMDVWHGLGVWGVPAVTFVFVPLLAYAVLKAQVVDIDLKIKLGVRRSVVLGAFLGIFFLVEQAVQSYFSATWGFLAGILAAALMLFAHKGVERVAGRVADAAMPRVRATPEYIHERKHEVYRAAFEGALSDGVVSDREREVLRRLRESLGLGEAEAALVESEASQGKVFTS